MAMAAATIYDVTSTDRSQRRLLPLPGALEIGFQTHILPATRPAQPLRWSAFPLACAMEMQVEPTGLPDDQGSGTNRADLEPNWSAAAALLLAAALVLLAFLL